MSIRRVIPIEVEKPYLVITRYGGRYWANKRFDTLLEAETFAKTQTTGRPHSTVTVYRAITAYRENNGSTEIKNI